MAFWESPAQSGSEPETPPIGVWRIPVNRTAILKKLDYMAGVILL